MPNVNVSIRDVGGQAVVVLRGELDLAVTPGAASHLIAAVAACGPFVIVDLAALESLGYGGLGVLVRVLKWTRDGGGEMSLAAPQPQVHRVLDITGLIDVFPVFPSVEQAVSSARRDMPRPPAALRPSRVAARSGRRQPAYCAACRPPAWRAPGHRTCWPRHTGRDVCRPWRRGTRAPLPAAYGRPGVRELRCDRVSHELRDDGMAPNRGRHRAHCGAGSTDAVVRPAGAIRCRFAAHADNRHPGPCPGPGHCYRSTIEEREGCPSLDRNSIGE